MTYGFYLKDIMNFDDLIDWLEDHIEITFEENDLGMAPPTLRADLKQVIKITLEKEISEYGWTGDEELPDLVVVNLFHEAFAAYHKSLYSLWFKENVNELEDDNPFQRESLKFAMEEVKKEYNDEGISLTPRYLVQEMKRGLHVKLFMLNESLAYTLGDESNVASIKAEGIRSSKEVATDLKKIMEKAFKVEKEIDSLIDSIEQLDYSTTMED